MALFDRCQVFVRGKQLRRVKSTKPSDELTREAFIPQGETRPVGTMVKPGAQYIELDVIPDTTPEVDWREFQRTGAILNVVLQYYGGAVKGPRRQFSMQVAEVHDPEANNQGEVTQTIKLVAIGEGRDIA